MATAPPLAPLSWRTPTLGDVLPQLAASLPVERVLLNPLPGTATEADVAAIHDREDRLCELVDGTLVEKTVGWKESSLAVKLVYFLMSFTEPRGLGLVLGPDGMVKLAPGLIRIPDVAFFSRERMARLSDRIRRSS